MLACCLVCGVLGRTKFVMNLDIHTFDKVITAVGDPRFAVVKFDTEWPHGAEHDAFNQFAELIALNLTFSSRGRRVPLLVGEVRMKDNTRGVNVDLVERFGWKTFQLPKIVLLAPPMLNESLQARAPESPAVEDEDEERDRRDQLELRRIASPKAQVFSVMSTEEMDGRTLDTIGRWALKAVANYSAQHSALLSSDAKSQVLHPEVWGTLGLPLNGTSRAAHCALHAFRNTLGDIADLTTASKTLRQQLEKSILERQTELELWRQQKSEEELNSLSDEKERSQRRDSRKSQLGLDKKALEYHLLVWDRLSTFLATHRSVTDWDQWVYDEQLKLLRVRNSDISVKQKQLTERKLNVLLEFSLPCA